MLKEAKKFVDNMEWHRYFIDEYGIKQKTYLIYYVGTNIVYIERSIKNGMIFGITNIFNKNKSLHSTRTLKNNGLNGVLLYLNY